MVQGVNDPVVMALLQKGLPATGENYNRMADALRMGGYTGNSAQPMTKQMMEMARGYMPTGDEPETVDNSMEESLKDDAYLDSMDEIRGTPPARSQAGGGKGVASPKKGVAPAGGETAAGPLTQAPQMSYAPPGVLDGTAPQMTPMGIDPDVALMAGTGALGVALKNLYDTDAMRAAPTPEAPKATGAKMLAPPAPMKQLPPPQKLLTDQRPQMTEAPPAALTPDVIEGRKPVVRVKAEGKLPNQSPLNEMEGSTSQQKNAPSEPKKNAAKAKAAQTMAAEKKAARAAARRIR